MDSSRCYTRGNKTYYDTAGLSFSEGIAASFGAGFEGAEVFNSEIMNCPKWVEQQVLARKRREQREAQGCCVIEAVPSQNDLFCPRKMRDVCIDDERRGEKTSVFRDWICEFCNNENSRDLEQCASCGAPFRKILS